MNAINILAIEIHKVVADDVAAPKRVSDKLDELFIFESLVKHSRSVFDFDFDSNLKLLHVIDEEET